MEDTSPPPSIDTAPIPKGMVSVTPHVLNATQVAAIRADAKALYSSGFFVPGGLRRRSSVDANSSKGSRHKKKANGRGKSEGDGNMKTTTDDTTRICDVCGIFDDAELAGPNVGDIDAREELLDLMADLREILQCELDIRLSEGMELQYLRYPGYSTSNNNNNKRGFYGRHFDSAPEDANTCKRKISLVLYLNEDGWDAEKDGGILRAYIRQPMTNKRNSSTAKNNIVISESTQDITPQGGKLVLFDSASVEHEVLPTCKERWAVVGWFLSDDNATTRQRRSVGGEDKKRSSHQIIEQRQPRKKKRRRKRRNVER